METLFHRIGADEIRIDGQAQAGSVGNIDAAAFDGEGFRHQVVHQGVMAQGIFNDEGRRRRGADLQTGGERQKKIASRFVNEKSLNTAQEIRELAADIGISAVTLAIAWSKQHDFVASTIVGTNTVEQLEDSLKSADMELDEDVMRRVDEITAKYPYPLG